MSFKPARVESLQGETENWTEVGPNNLYGVDFQNSWVNFGGSYETAAFYKDKFNRVWLKGSVKNGTVGNVPAFTLPESYRPNGIVLYASTDGTGTPSARIVVYASDGHVEITAGNNAVISLDGISWRV